MCVHVNSCLFIASLGLGRARDLPSLQLRFTASSTSSPGAVMRATECPDITLTCAHARCPRVRNLVPAGHQGEKYRAHRDARRRLSDPGSQADMIRSQRQLRRLRLGRRRLRPPGRAVPGVRGGHVLTRIRVGWPAKRTRCAPARARATSPSVEVHDYRSARPVSASKSLTQRILVDAIRR
jgi:hypothetical protein